LIKSLSIARIIHIRNSKSGETTSSLIVFHQHHQPVSKATFNEEDKEEDQKNNFTLFFSVGTSMLQKIFTYGKKYK